MLSIFSLQLDERSSDYLPGESDAPGRAGLALLVRTQAKQAHRLDDRRSEELLEVLFGERERELMGVMGQTLLASCDFGVCVGSSRVTCRGLRS